MTRVENLNAYFDRVRRRKFRPGSHDCAMYAAAWVKIATGVDYAKQFRGKYRSMDAGHVLLKEAGFDAYGDFVASLLPEIHPSAANVGDLAVIEGRAIGIFASDRVFLLRPDGLGHVSRLLAERAFKV
jgi:hypothetical protein